VLEFPDGAAECLPLAGVLGGLLEQVLGAPDRLRAEFEPAKREEVHRLVEAAVDLAEDTVLGQADIVEDEFGLHPLQPDGVLRSRGLW